MIECYLKKNSSVSRKGKLICSLYKETPSIIANKYYFNNPNWASTYLKTCHRDKLFRERWLAGIGSLDNRIVVDIGCGPGNLIANLKGKTKLLIGVDVAQTSLLMAERLGYVPIIADAHDLPLVSSFADIVALNASLHHCDDMKRVLAEAARLVRPRGMLVVDHDPQLSAWNYRGLGLWLYDIRLNIIYKKFLRNLYIPKIERDAALATETHHKPGSGVTSELFYKVLNPMGFEVDLYPHNNNLGAEVFNGNCGNPPHWRYRVGQLLSGINPFLKSSALSLMCIAKLPAIETT